MKYALTAWQSSQASDTPPPPGQLFIYMTYLFFFFCQEFGRFFHKQLASILQDSLSRFTDRK